jgi:hypothetical protein
MKFLAALVALSPSAQDPAPVDLEVRTEGGYIRLRGADISFSDDGVWRGQASGTNAMLVDTARGITLVGRSMNVVLRPLGEGRYMVQEAILTDDARATYDSKMAYDSAVQFATAARPAPSKPDAFGRTELKSQQILYRVEGEVGKLSLPEPLDLRSHSEGEEVAVKQGQTSRTPFVQDLAVVGSKAEFTIGPSATAVAEPKEGFVDGPVSFKLDRVETVPVPETPDKTRDERTHVEGFMDRLEADLDGPGDRALTAIGNVRLNGTGRGLSGRVTGARAIISVDENLQPIRYRFTGEPTTTRIRMGIGR